MKLSELVGKNAVVVPLGSTERDGVVEELVRAAVGDASEPLVESLINRERKGTTGFGRGVAVPHAKHPAVGRVTGAIGLSPGGIDFSSLDEQPVHVVFLLLSPEDRPEDHLRSMELVFKHLSREAFRVALRNASTPDEVLALLDEADMASVDA